MSKASKQRTRARPPATAHADTAAAVSRDDSPLAWLARRKDKDGNALLEDYEFAAGERLTADFWFGQMMPRVTAQWSDGLSGSNRRTAPDHGAALSAAALAARERVRDALAAVGPEFCDILIDVCCYWKGLEQVEKALGWPQRCAKVILKKALRQLARHYGFIDQSGGRHSSRARPSHWGTEDFRPRADAPRDTPRVSTGIDDQG